MTDRQPAYFLPARYTELWQRLGVSHPDIATAGERLLTLYSDPARTYHNTAHLADVLAKLDWAKDALDKTGELAGLGATARQKMFDTIELALFYHDAVYDAHAKDNEAQSRDLIQRDAAAFGLDPAITKDAARLIDLTAHHGQAQALDEKIMADCDLAILGAAPEAFKKYDDGIRREYAHVPAPLYAAGRAKVLRGFLDAPPLFKTAAFAAQYDAPARRNLAHAVQAPSPMARIRAFLFRP
jgi:predicted metal-dependent HD superfamily phosphohydrolase